MSNEATLESSRLYKHLAADPDLLSAIHSLREMSARLSAEVARTLPGFTDHSVRHTDALWAVADKVLSNDETDRLTSAEAFLLACGFYLHDVGMAYAATEAGVKELQTAPQYLAALVRYPEAQRSDPAVQARLLGGVVRALHAGAAMKLALDPVPGTGWYLIEAKSVRDAWGQHAGKVAASHHWSLERVERELGGTGIVPLPGGREGDLGYVAALLRVIDFAHINRDRAPAIDRAFRPSLEPESLLHWLAQENIDGPSRDGADLLYNASQPVADVDAWWLYYEMLKGLDEEIRLVRRYLEQRPSSRGRFSLQGVRGAIAPEQAIQFIPTAGFLPLEVNLKTGSIERLVELLAGESLYGPDTMTAVRELIQNARDAVMLKRATASSELERAALGLPIKVTLRTEGDQPRLEVVDYGVGMSRKVMTDYLVSIASDYWSTQFATDFPTAEASGFTPAGKFGIGFLSAFMLGDSVTVESNRLGEERHQLQLRGLGRRGELRTQSAPSGSGSKVQVRLKPGVADSLRPFSEMVRVYAPMLPHPLEVDENGVTTSLAPGWLDALDAQGFHKWILHAIEVLARNRFGRQRKGRDLEGVEYVLRERTRWLYGRGAGAETSWTEGWPEYREEGVRLVASFEGVTLLSLRGLAVQAIGTPGFVGVIDLPSASPDVSRRMIRGADVTGTLNRAVSAVKPHVVRNLDALGREGVLVDKLGHLTRSVGYYGREVLLEASLPWISQLLLPGDVRLRNCSDLRREISAATSLFVAHGTGPWTAMRKWVALEPCVQPAEVAIVLDDSPSERVDYYSGTEEKVGRLTELWPKCQDTALLGTVIRLTAEAWQMSPDDLVFQDGWRHKGSTVWGRLSRT